MTYESIIGYPETSQPSLSPVPGAALQAAHNLMGMSTVTVDTDSSANRVSSDMTGGSQVGHRYNFVKFTEESDPALTELAWRTHAAGYRSMDFVNDSAITPEGFMIPEVDKSRGEHTDYYLALNPQDPTDVGTLRMVNLPEGGTFRDLPAYKISVDKLSSHGIQLLESISNQETRLKEVAAMARTPSASPMAIHELLREVFREVKGKDEIWFFSIVNSTFDSLASSFGKSNFDVIGDDVPIGDDHISNQILLRPALLYPDRFLDNLAASYEQAESKLDRNRYLRSLLFFVQDLPTEELSDQVQNVLQAIPLRRQVGVKAVDGANHD